MLSFALRDVPLSEIDATDATFCLRSGADLDDRTRQDILKRGLYYPLLLAERGNSLILVDGFSRLLCLRENGARSAPAQIAPRDARPQDLLALAVRRNQDSRGLNGVEKARSIAQQEAFLLEAGWEAGHIEQYLLREWLPLLGDQPSPSLLERYRSLAEAPKAVQDRLAAGAVPEAALSLLLELEPSAQEACSAMIAHYRLSTGMSRDLLRLTREICLRDAVTARGLFAEMGFAPEDGAGGTRDTLLHALRQRRFPILSSLEKQYAALHAEAGFDGGLRLRPPRHFEGDGYLLEMPCRDEIEFANKVGRLAQMLDAEANTLQRLFHLTWERDAE